MGSSASPGHSARDDAGGGQCALAVRHLVGAVGIDEERPRANDVFLLPTLAIGLIDSDEHAVPAFWSIECRCPRRFALGNRQKTRSFQAKDQAEAGHLAS